MIPFAHALDWLAAGYVSLVDSWKRQQAPEGTKPEASNELEIFNRSPDMQSDGKASVPDHAWASWRHNEKGLDVWWHPDGSYDLHPWSMINRGTVERPCHALTQHGVEPTEENKLHWWNWLENEGEV